MDSDLLRRLGEDQARADFGWSAVRAALLAGAGAGTQVRTALYFATFLGALGTILARFPWARCWRQRPWLLLTVPYSLVALAATWRLILIFIVAHERRYDAHPDAPNLFVEAYVLVCDEAAGWWWSAVLLGWVAVACPLAFEEAACRGMSPRLALAYVATAFLGAVTLSFPLLFAHLLMLRPTTASRGLRVAAKALPPWLWPACTTAAIASSALMPLTISTSRPVFIAALITMHTVLIVPFVALARAAGPDSGAAPPGSPRPAPGLEKAARSRYLALALFTAALYVGSSAAALVELRALIGAPLSLAALRDVLGALGAAAGRNACQASISIDAVGASVAGSIFMLCTRPRDAATPLLLSPLIGPAAALALFCAQRHGEGRDEALIREGGDGAARQSARLAGRVASEKRD